MSGLFAFVRKSLPAAPLLAAAAALAALAAAAPASADSFQFGYRSGPAWNGPHHKHHKHWRHHRHGHRRHGTVLSYTYIAPAYRYHPAPVYVAPPPVVYAPPAIYGAPPVAAAPASPVYQAANGQYCREYQATVMVGGRPQASHGTACLQPDGVWRVVN